MKAIHTNTGIFLILTLCLILSLISPKKSFATGSDSDNQFITIVNPIRVSRYTKNLQSSFIAQYQETQKRNLPATWLLTYDVLENQGIISELSKIDTSYELGIFFEVTPNFASKAQIEYNKTDSWHRAHALFLSGYKREDRDKLIDTVFEKFKLTFGYYPKSVGAWWIDSYSLDYMQQKYNIIANLGLADQFATDGYQVWGQFWSTPFIPNKFHAGIPAKNSDEKINLVTIEWAPRDPLNGYGLNPANNYSTQDYLTINLTDDYFSKLLDLYSSKNFNQFGQITIGLETDLDPTSYHGNYARWLDIAKDKNVKFLTMSDFANWYLNNYQITPPHTIVTDDLLGSQRKAIWYQSPFYRVGMSYDGKHNISEIFDFRIYPGNFEEPHNISPNRQLNLYINLPSVLDKAGNPNDKWVISEKKLTDIKKDGKDLIIKFEDEEIRFTENNILLRNIKSLPSHLRTSPILKINNWFPNITLNPQEKYFIPQGGKIFRGLSIEARYFLNRPKVALLTKIIVLLALLALYLLARSKLTKRAKFIIISFFIAVTSTGGFGLYYSNSQKFEVSQSEADALSHLAVLPYGKVVVYDDGCLICTWQTKHPPPTFANNRGYVQTISKKPILYNLKIFTAKTRQEGREELKNLAAKYIYVTKFEEYQEILPFSPGDYFIDMVYENANAQIWKIRDNAPL